MKPIGYVSEHPTEYAEELRKCDTLAALREFVAKWRPVADDAYRVVEGMDEKSFKKFQRGLAIETKGKYAGDEWCLKYGDIPMPEMLLLASLVAEQFKAPWGTAFIRLMDVGQIKLKKGIYVRVPPKKQLQRA